MDTTNADQFQKDVAVLMEASQPDIEIDCSAMEYTSSQGLRVFLQLQKNVTAHQGNLVLTRMQPHVKEHASLLPHMDRWNLGLSANKLSTRKSARNSFGRSDF